MIPVSIFPQLDRANPSFLFFHLSLSNLIQLSKSHEFIRGKPILSDNTYSRRLKGSSGVAEDW